MKLPRYPKYKDSGVEWLGEVPEHWNPIPVKHLAEFINGDAFKPSEWTESGIPIIRIQNLNGSEEFNYYDGQVEQQYLVHDGDLLFGWSGNRGTSFGPFLWSCTEVCALNQHIFRVVPNSVDKLSLFWILKAVTVHVEDQAHGIIGMVHVTKGDLGAIKVPAPPMSELSLITRFLECETGKIDVLVEEQRRLIELLKEKRQAVISHAVTKGLNPDTPMKDSGIEWLGEVPAHWKQTVIKRFSTLQRGHDLTDEQRTDGPYPVVTSSGISGTHGSFMASAPGVVTGRYGSMGKLFYVEEDFWPHNTSLYVIDFHGNKPRFVWYALQTVDFAAHSAKAAVPGIDRNDIHVLPVSVPPKDEQSAIVEYLDEETTRYDAFIAAATHAIDLLQERRTALISAAVTGKIDVRGLSGTEAA